jgi:hypothetical protein
MNEDWRNTPPESEPASPPPQVRKLSELIRLNGDDPNELLKHRFLCTGAGLLLAGPTGIGKSAFGLQCAVLWALGKPCFEIAPARGLRSLLIQAENDDNDLAEMRDGILAGLEFTPVQSATACDNILVCREDSRAGFVFFSECVKPLLTEHKPDLLWIDPALSYLGGECNSQRDVGAFLRNNLNPVLHQFNCAGIVVHHTNKPPTGKEKPEWSNSDFAYLGSGSSEWANWARAMLAIRATGQQGFFELRAGKRGSRLGWLDESGAISHAKFICHATEPGIICWREADPDGVKKGGRPREYDIDDLLALLPDEGFTSTEWQNEARKECGIKERRFYQLIKELESQGRAIKSKITKRWLRITKRA